MCRLITVPFLCFITHILIEAILKRSPEFVDTYLAPLTDLEQLFVCFLCFDHLLEKVLEV